MLCVKDWNLSAGRSWLLLANVLRKLAEFLFSSAFHTFFNPILLRNVELRWLEKTLRAHQRCINSLETSAGGLLTAGKDGFVKLWTIQLRHLKTFDLNEVIAFSDGVYMCEYETVDFSAHKRI